MAVAPEALPKGQLHGGARDPPAAMSAPALGGRLPVPDPESVRLTGMLATHLDASLSGMHSGSILTEAHAVFTLLDRDTTGTLDMAELVDLRRRLKKIHPDRYPDPLTPAFADRIVGRAVESGGKGMVSRPDWIDFVIAQSKETGERPMKKLMNVLAREMARRWRPS